MLRGISRREMAGAPRTLVNVEGVYVIEYSWRFLENPSGQQRLWIFYHAESASPIRRLLEDLEFCVTHGSSVRFSRAFFFFGKKKEDFVARIVELSGGKVSIAAFTAQIGKVKGHMGVVADQGRVVDLEAEETAPMLATLIGNLEVDPSFGSPEFVRKARGKLRRLVNTLNATGRSRRRLFQRVR